MARKYLGRGRWVTIPDSSSKNSGGSDRRSVVDSAFQGDSSEGKNDSKLTDSKAKKKLMESESNILSGDISLNPLVTVKPRSTITLSGLGSSLSGLYFVESVKYSFSSDNGFTKSCSVSRNGFGSYIKKGHIIVKNEVKKDTSYRVDSSKREEITPKIESRTHVVKSGDTLWLIAVKYYGKKNGSLYTRIAEANNIEPSDYNNLKVGRRLIIP